MYIYFILTLLVLTTMAVIIETIGILKEKKSLLIVASAIPIICGATLFICNFVHSGDVSTDMIANATFALEGMMTKLVGYTVLAISILLSIASLCTYKHIANNTKQKEIHQNA